MTSLIFIWISFVVICNYANCISVLPFAQGSRTKREAGENTEIDADNFPLELSTSVQHLMNNILSQLAEHADIIKQLNQRQENTQLEMAEFKDVSKALRSLILDMGVDVRGMGQTKPSNILHDNVGDIEAKWYQNQTIIQDVVDAQLSKVTTELDLLRDQNTNQTSLIQSLQEHMDSLYAEQLKLQTELNVLKIGHQMETEETDHPANQVNTNTSTTDSISIQSESKHQNLTAIHVGELPSGVYGSCLFYDGSDSIYLIGANFTRGTSFVGSLIMQFNITSSTTKIVGKLPGYFVDGPLQENNGNIFIFGYYPRGPSSVWKYNPQLNKTSVVGEIPHSQWRSTTVNTADGNILILGGSQRNGILSFNTSTGNVTTLPNMTTTWGSRQITAVRVEDKAFIFGPQDPPSSSFVKMDLKTLEEERVSSNLPIFDYHTASAFDGENIYLYGITTDEVLPRGIIKFNPQTHEWIRYNVEFSPHDTAGISWGAPLMIFVRKLKRIYIFGAYSNTGSRNSYNDIWYIDV